MSRTRPAPLSSDLLAPKGGAAPAIRDKSPFLRSVAASAAPVVAKLPLAEPASAADTSPEPALAAEPVVAPAPRASGRRRVAAFAAALAVALLAAVAIGVTNRESPAPPPAPQPEAAAAEPPAPTAPAEAAVLPPAAPDLAPSAPAAELAETPPAPDPAPPASAAPLPKTKPPAAPEAPANGRYAVQFASATSADGARREAQRIARKLNAALQGRDVAVVRAETRDQGTRYRVVAHGYATLAAARAACAAARERDEDCLVVRR